MSQSKENLQTEGQKDEKTEGQTLIHRTIPAQGPITVDSTHYPSKYWDIGKGILV